jgi:hypothetical protein
VSPFVSTRSAAMALGKSQRGSTRIRRWEDTLLVPANVLRDRPTELGDANWLDPAGSSLFDS